jgi:hypothetical protein
MDHPGGHLSLFFRNSVVSISSAFVGNPAIITNAFHLSSPLLGVFNHGSVNLSVGSVFRTKPRAPHLPSGKISTPAEYSVSLQFMVLAFRVVEIDAIAGIFFGFLDGFDCIESKKKGLLI